MNLLFLGYDENHLKIINKIKKNYVVNAVDYENVSLPSNVYVKDIERLCLDDYKMIFISESLFSNYIGLFENYYKNAIIFRGLSKIRLDELKNEIRANYLINELSLKQGIGRPNIFIYGYNHLGVILSNKLLSMDKNIRVGVTSKDELFDLLHQKISCVFAANNNTMVSLIESDEFIINTTPNLFSPKIIERIQDHMVDINDYDTKQKENHQKVYVSK